MSKPVTAIYPGSFDPVTNGHLDLIARGAMIFDQLIVAVAQNLEKEPLFAVKERVEMLESITFEWKNVEVDTFNGLLVEYARSQNASVIMRGIRAVSDYEYELQMAMMNRKIEPDIETVFMLPAEAVQLPQLPPGPGNRPPGRPRQGPRPPDRCRAPARKSRLE